MATFDYIVVGGGSAGCVLAARLAENRSNRVLLLEAGGPDKGALLDMPLRWFEAMRNPGLGWGFVSEPEPYADNRRIPAPRGKVLGGCSSINGMMYSRGNRAAFRRYVRFTRNFFATQPAAGLVSREWAPVRRGCSMLRSGSTACQGCEWPIAPRCRRFPAAIPTCPPSCLPKRPLT